MSPGDRTEPHLGGGHLDAFALGYYPPEKRGGLKNLESVKKGMYQCRYRLPTTSQKVNKGVQREPDSEKTFAR